MTALMRVTKLWRGQYFWLILGAAMAAAGAVTAMALTTSAGAVFATGLIAAPLILRLAGPVRVVLRYLERLVAHGALFRAQGDLRVWFFRGLALRLAGGLGMRRAGDILARLVGDVETLDVLYIRILLPLGCAVLVFPVLVVFAARADAGLAFVLAALFMLAAFVLPGLAARWSASGGGDLAVAMAGLRIAILDSLIGLREVRAFAAEGRMLAQMQSRESMLLAAQRKLAAHGAWAGAAAFLCAQAAVLAALLMAPAELGAAGASVALVFLVLAAFDQISLLPRAGTQAGSATAAAVRVLEAAEGPIPLPDPSFPAAMPAGNALRFEGVHFRWQDDRDKVFDGLTLDIQEGSRVALLGPSGAGKSTFAALALRLAAPQQGRVLLGGPKDFRNAADLAAADIRRRIGWLNQATHLFDDTIRANLLLARPDATDDQLWQALDQAQIGDTVRALPARLDTYLGEAGQGFSGGQGRRLALARTLLSPARILILDEPCAGLDADTERGFLTTLNATADNRTIILIAHRLTGVERLDRIYRLNAGKAVAAAG